MNRFATMRTEVTDIIRDVLGDEDMAEVKPHEIVGLLHEAAMDAMDELRPGWNSAGKYKEDQR